MLSGYIVLDLPGLGGAAAVIYVYDRKCASGWDPWEVFPLSRIFYGLMWAPLTLATALLIVGEFVPAAFSQSLEAYMAARVPALNWPSVESGPAISRFSLSVLWLIAAPGIFLGFLTGRQTARHRHWVEQYARAEHVFFASLAFLVGGFAVVFVGIMVPIGEPSVARDVTVQGAFFGMLIGASFKLTAAARLMFYPEEYKN